MIDQKQLIYAPPLHWYQRRKVRRVFLAIVLLAVGWIWGPATWHGVESLYWQRRCQDYQAPSMVVYEPDPSLAAVLIKSGKGYAPILEGWGVYSREAMYIPPCFANFSASSGFALPAVPVIFLHERVSASGLRRIVVVQCRPMKDLGYEALTNHLDAYAIEPRHSLLKPKSWNELPVGPNTLPPPGLRSGQPVRLYAGQPDPSDASHFTIRYHLKSGDGVIDGWLRDTGRVDLKIRDGPAVGLGSPNH